jgi:nitrile hydratase
MRIGKHMRAMNMLDAPEPSLRISRQPGVVVKGARAGADLLAGREACRLGRGPQGRGPAGEHRRHIHRAQGRLGRIEHVHGAHVFADAHAQGLGEQPQWLYTVLFTGRELWGDGAEEGLTVSIDAWEAYLEPAA